LVCRKSFFCHTFYWLLIFSLFCPAIQRAGAKPVKGEDGKPVAFPNSSITILKDRDYLPALKDAIDKAKREITLSYFNFKTKGNTGNYPDIVLRSLIAAAKKGVRVTVLLEQSSDAGDSTSRENRRTMGRLRKMGVSVYLDSPETTTHTKMAVVDGRYTFIGSHNLTQSALKYNNEMSVMIESPQVASEALEYIKSLIPTHGNERLKKDEK
jgi:phosphatidylserine/phosphatidylglycerophosphate/cardiolipin synthase-like enzyme